jgi:hypothetical protein
MKRITKTAVPEFSSVEQEKEYWESRGILDQTRTAKINQVPAGTKRASFLNIRLSGAELTQLRDLAAAAGTGPSTYARILIKKILDQNLKPGVKIYSQPREKVFLARDSELTESKSINPGSIAVVELGKSKVDADIVKSLFETLQKTCQCTVLNPQEPGYSVIERIIREIPSE